MNKNSIPSRIWNRIIRATKTNDAQINGVCLMWLFTIIGSLTSSNGRVPIWYTISFGSIWIIIAFIHNLINPLDED